MALRTGVGVCRFFSPSFRKYSGSASLINVGINEKSGIATATLQRPPVNSLNLELLTELSNTLTELERNKCRGLILTSNFTSVFSAGLDIMEMYKPEVDRLKQFWTSVQQAWINLYGTSYPTVAVINGHAPAGGCLMAMSCEYRIMLNNFTIGLNETKLGMVAPKWFITTMQNTIGRRQSELGLTSGRLFKTDEALSIGLVDEVTSTKEEAIARAEKFFERFAGVSPMARAVTKKALRGKDIQDLVNNKQQDMEQFIRNVKNELVQKEVEKYLQSLKQKGK